MEEIIRLENELIRLKASQDYGKSVSTVKVLEATHNRWDSEGDMVMNSAPGFWLKTTIYRVYSNHKISLGEIKVEAMVNGELLQYQNRKYTVNAFASNFTGVDSSNITKEKGYYEFPITVYAETPNRPSYKVKVWFKTLDAYRLEVV